MVEFTEHICDCSEERLNSKLVHRLSEPLSYGHPVEFIEYYLKNSTKERFCIALTRLKPARVIR